MTITRPLLERGKGITTMVKEKAKERVAKERVEAQSIIMAKEKERAEAQTTTTNLAKERVEAQTITTVARSPAGVEEATTVVVRNLEANDATFHQPLPTRATIPKRASNPKTSKVGETKRWMTTGATTKRPFQGPKGEEISVATLLDTITMPPHTVTSLHMMDIMGRVPTTMATLDIFVDSWTGITMSGATLRVSAIASLTALPSVLSRALLSVLSRVSPLALLKVSHTVWWKVSHTVL